MLAALVDAITLFAYAHLLVIISVQQASLNIKMSNILGEGICKELLADGLFEQLTAEQEFPFNVCHEIVHSAVE